MRRIVLALGLSACTSFTFDSSAPDIPLVGSAPATTSLPRLNQNPASNLTIVAGANGSSWASFQETVRQPDGSMVKAIRNVNLSGAGEELLTADHLDRYTHGFYLINRPKDAMPPVTNLTIHTPGSSVDDQFTLPGGPGKVLVGSLGGANDNIFIYLVLSKDATSFSVYRRDKHDLPLRSFNIPNLCMPDSTMPCTDPTDPTSTIEFRYQFAGSRLFWRDLNTKNLSWHSLVPEANGQLIDQDLGPRPQSWYVDEANKNVLTCGADGLRQVPLDNSGDKMLDSDPCAALIALLGGQVIYAVGGELRKVSLMGEFGPMKILDASKRLIGTWGNDKLFYSTDPANRYVNSVGDGWLTGPMGDWKFMTRGGDLSLFGGKELRWVDNAAQMSGIGDLYFAPVYGKPAPLARNVSEYDGLSDGRILIEENHAERSIENRVVVLDAQKKQKRWVAQQASSFMCIDYCCSNTLVDVVSGATGYDVVRVNVPPALCDQIVPGQDHPSGSCGFCDKCNHAGEGTWDCTCDIPKGKSSGTWSCTQP